MREKRARAHESGEATDKATNDGFVRQAILDAANEIAVPAFVSTVSICIVFTPVLLLTEPAKSLFTPLAMAVCGSMMASYFLSRTVVPVMAKYMLGGHADPHKHANPGPVARKLSIVTKAVDRKFNNLRDAYHSALGYILDRRMFVVVGVVIFIAVSFSCIPFLGEDFFPSIDAQTLRMHVSAPRGLRVEETERLIKTIERTIKSIIPRRRNRKYRRFNGCAKLGTQLVIERLGKLHEADGEILVTLVEKSKKPGSFYRGILRDKLPQLYPTCEFFFQPADIVTQILNAGLAAPIDIQVRGQDLTGDYHMAEKIRDEIKKIPGAVDVHIKQSISAPVINVDVDRQKASQIGFTQRDVSGSMLVSLSSSFQTAPNFWVNPKNGVSYSLAVQTPQRLIASLGDLSNTVVTNADGSKRQLLGNLADFRRSVTPTIINHYNVQPIIDVLASVDGTDLNSVATKVLDIVARYKKNLPHAMFIDVAARLHLCRRPMQGFCWVWSERSSWSICCSSSTSNPGLTPASF